MIAGEDKSGLEGVSPDEARAELERLLADPRFHATDRAKRILRYIAERCFEGETVGVKAYAIALDVLNRPTHFDTNSDPIVRIEISRLRNALSNYYEAYGNELEIIATLPVGHYLAVFTRSVGGRNSGVEPAQDAYLSGVATEVEGAPMRSPLAWARWVPTTAGVAAIALAGSAWSLMGQTPDITTRPSVSLTMTAADNQHGKEADEMRRYLAAALSRFRTLEMNTRTYAAVRASIPAYDIEMKYYADDDDRTIWWQVVDGRDGSILKSGIEKVPIDGRSAVAVRDELVSILAKRLASARGVISNIEAHQDMPARMLGNVCVLRAEIALDEGGGRGIATSIPCLERTLARQPNNADAMAILSRALVASKGGDPRTTDFARATMLANQAVSIDPGSDRAYVALMMAQFYTGKTEPAIAAGNRALSLNPDNPDVLAKLAGVLFSAGYRKAATSLAGEASEHVEAVPRDAVIVLALDAYLRRDWSNASLFAEQINCSDFVVRAIRAASLGEMNASDARRSLAYLKQIMPDYETAMGVWMERRKYPEDVIEALERGLGKAERMQDRIASAAIH